MPTNTLHTQYYYSLQAQTCCVFRTLSKVHLQKHPRDPHRLNIPRVPPRAAAGDAGRRPQEGCSCPSCSPRPRQPPHAPARPRHGPTAPSAPSPEQASRGGGCSSPGGRGWSAGPGGRSRPGAPPSCCGSSWPQGRPSCPARPRSGRRYPEMAAASPRPHGGAGRAAASALRHGGDAVHKDRSQERPLGVSNAWLYL